MKIRLILIIAAIFFTFQSCGEKTTPEGPSDIRIKNLTDLTFEDLTVDTSGGTNQYDPLTAGEFTVYKRFDKAYRFAEVTAIIGGELYSTGTQNYNYEIVLGQGKFTYEVYIENASLKRLAIARVIPEAPLD
jgi:hypothetical protein